MNVKYKSQPRFQNSAIERLASVKIKQNRTSQKQCFGVMLWMLQPVVVGDPLLCSSREKKKLDKHTETITQLHRNTKDNLSNKLHISNASAEGIVECNEGGAVKMRRINIKE